MDTQSLETFLMLSKLKNFTLTADKLYVAQSTVTNRIAELEKVLGRKLFIRDKKHVELTGEGILFESYARRILELEKSAVQEINQAVSYKSTIRIGSAQTIYDCHLYPIISSFLKGNSDIGVKITLGHSNLMLEKLDDSLLDLVFSYIDYRKHGYKSVPFINDEMILVTSSENNDYTNGITKKELLKESYLMCDLVLDGTGQFVRRLFPPYYQFRFEIDTSTKLLQYLIDGFGYSFLPKSLVEPYIEKNILISIPLIDFEAPQLKSYFVYKADNKKVQALINKCQKD